MKIDFVVNHRTVTVETDPTRRLLDVLRDDLGLLSVKEGCGEGECGACTVMLNGRSVLSCMVMVGQVQGSEILTSEGLVAEDGALHPIQEAFIDAGAVQCGFCTPGFVISTYALLQDHPKPTEDQIKRGLSGNLCRCTGYAQIIEAVQKAAKAGHE